MTSDRHPIPSITRLHKGISSVRRGRGFSIGELTSAGLGPSQARIIKVFLDFRRKTIYESNVNLLRMKAEAERRERKDSSRELEETA